MADTMNFPDLSLLSLAGRFALCHEAAGHRQNMKPAQSPHIPASGEWPGLADVPWLFVYCTRALFELVRARIIFAGLEARAIPERNRRTKKLATPGSRLSPKAIDRISYVVPRLSDRLPWRSDCLIQAIAAQNWLASQGEASEIQIGVEHPEDGPFGAHAWLIHDGKVVTGGDIAKYALILGDSSGNTESSDRTGPENGG